MGMAGEGARRPSGVRAQVPALDRGLEEGAALLLLSHSPLFIAIFCCGGPNTRNSWIIT